MFQIVDLLLDGHDLAAQLFMDLPFDPDSLLCGELLQHRGIREPLYVTALKYAGVRLTADMLPSRLAELKLSPEQKQQVKHWFETQPAPAAEPEKKLLRRLLKALKEQKWHLHTQAVHMIWML